MTDCMIADSTDVDFEAPPLAEQIRILLDDGLGSLVGRSLIPAEEVLDLLLDVRHLTILHGKFADRLFQMWKSSVSSHILPEWTMVEKRLALLLVGEWNLIARYSGSGVWTVWRDDLDGSEVTLLGEFDKFEMRKMAEEEAR